MANTANTALTLERPAPRTEGQGRDLSLDLIRAVGGVLVVAIHFFLNCGYQTQTMEGLGMWAMTVVRMGCMTAVPIFLLLSGYLCCNKLWSVRYYTGIIRVLLTYLLGTLGCFVYRWTVLREAVSLEAVVKGLVRFNGAPYAWYIEMYIGLFLLIPFVNLAWKGAETKAARGAMVLTLLGLTTLPGLCNTWGAVLPDWWSDLYPLAYYFLGAYFRTYQTRVKLGRGLAGFILAVCAGGGLGFLVNHGAPYLDIGLSSWAGPTVVASSCLLFLLLRQLPLDNAPRWLKWLIRKAAQLSLPIYLVSWCFDSALYPYLWVAVPGMAQRWPYYFVMVPAVYLASAAVGQVLEWARMGITWALNKLFPRLGLK